MKTKRFAALVATGLLTVQMFGVGVARAGSSACDFGSDDLEVTIDSDRVALRINDEFLECDDSYNGTFSAASGSVALSALDSILVEMDDEEASEGDLTIELTDGGNANEPGEWPTLSSFDINVTTPVTLDASGMGNSTPGVRVIIGAKSVSFEGTTATSNAPAYTVLGSDGRDTIDGSKATVKLTVDGDENNDLIKGGSARDDIDGGAGSDTIYGGLGNDILDGSDSSDADQCWGQDGDDFITGCLIIAPGAGDDTIESLDTGSAGQRVTYADAKAGVTFTQLDCDGKISTGGAAGNDEFDQGVARIYGSPFDDGLFNACTDDGYNIISGGDGNDRIGLGYSYYNASSPYVKWGAFGGAGDDFLTEFDAYGRSAGGGGQFFSGGPGNDTIRAGYGYDYLDGGKGRDTLNAGPGTDTCRHGEVLSSCDQVAH